MSDGPDCDDQQSMSRFGASNNNNVTSCASALWTSPLQDELPKGYLWQYYVIRQVQDCGYNFYSFEDLNGWKPCEFQTVLYIKREQGNDIIIFISFVILTYWALTQVLNSGLYRKCQTTYSELKPQNKGQALYELTRRSSWFIGYVYYWYYLPGALAYRPQLYGTQFSNGCVYNLTVFFGSLYMVWGCWDSLDEMMLFKLAWFNLLTSSTGVVGDLIRIVMEDILSKKVPFGKESILTSYPDWLKSMFPLKNTEVKQEQVTL